METLSDLTQLSEFEGTRVPAAPLNGPCLSLFGQILTHPSRVTFPWAPLRHALYTYFGSPPSNLDPHKIGAGWCGLSLILTAFKRLEVVESQEETQEVLTWLHALKIAAVRRSLAFEITTVTTLQDVLSNLLEPVPAEELQVARSRHNSTASSLPPYQKPVASTPSLSFERGSDATRSPSEGAVGSPDPANGAGQKRGSEQRGDSPASKKRRSESFGQQGGVQGLGGQQRGRVSDVSTSAVSF
ncbi:hypothetical protein BCR35DRAFT_44697 [Leucosporidium creatinivorum]|uniref:Uncharacterized protein n=1 Tax=Leucosporidium creatinivorum TaxID=106004 RepID=A0A1Y2FRW0_9BASI|nr:hypothetical protein BCR35DRAFT_44697 [Leucosporidium creatinivorum]